MKRRIIFATSNEGKIKEIRMILKGLECEVLSLKEAGIGADIKAKTVMEFTDAIVIADDSGLEIDALDKQPGIHSSRFLGEDTPYDVKNQYILDKLKDVKWEDRTARFVCAVACAYPGGQVITKRGVMEGYIGYEIKGENGFGYDPIFWLAKYNATSAELTPEQKNIESHRGKALEGLKAELKELCK